MSMHIIICIIKYGWARGSEFWINSISIRWEKMHPFYVTDFATYLSTLDILFSSNHNIHKI